MLKGQPQSIHETWIFSDRKNPGFSKFDFSVTTGSYASRFHSDSYQDLCVCCRSVKNHPATPGVLRIQCLCCNSAATVLQPCCKPSHFRTDQILQSHHLILLVVRLCDIP